MTSSPAEKNVSVVLTSFSVAGINKQTSPVQDASVKYRYRSPRKCNQQGGINLCLRSFQVFCLRSFFAIIYFKSGRRRAVDDVDIDGTTKWLVWGFHNYLLHDLDDMY